MYLFRFLNTPLGHWVGAATQTFAPGGKYPRAATGDWDTKSSDLDCFEMFIKFILCNETM